MKHFANYAKFCFNIFGNRVKNWFSFNEPRGYDTRLFAPARCSKTFRNCTKGKSAIERYIVVPNIIKCFGAIVGRYREKYQVKFIFH